MKKIILLLFIIGKCLVSYAQQDPLYSQYLLNPFIINPAYSGYAKDATAWASYRLQWAGIDGAPDTKSIAGHIALMDNKMGLGLTIVQDNAGIDKNTQAVASYAYHLQLDGPKISFGLRGGMANFRRNYETLQVDETDPRFQQNVSEMSPVVGAGLLYSSERFLFGVSVPNMLDASTAVNGMESILYNRHAYAQVAYLMQVSPSIRVKPFALARMVRGTNVNFDLGAMLTADDSYTAGLFTRGLHTYGALLKLNVGEMLRIGYIFEIPTNSSVGINHTTHEFTVGVRLAVFRFHDLEAISAF